MSARLFIDGEWVDAQGGTLDAVDPATEEVIDQIGVASRDDVNAAVAAARGAFEAPEWAGLEPKARAALLFRLADLVEAHGDELAELETRDQGMPLGLVKAITVGGAVDHFRYYAGWATKIMGTTNPVSGPDTFNFTRREPVGVNALVTP